MHVPRAKQIIITVVSAMIGVMVTATGLWMAYLGTIYYRGELRYPYGAVALWKSAIIVFLIAACAIVPTYAGYRFIKFAAKDL